MPHPCLSAQVLMHVWNARAGGLELGHAWISLRCFLGRCGFGFWLGGVRSTEFWLEGYRATEYCYRYRICQGLRDHIFQNQHQHRRHRQVQDQHRHQFGSDCRGGSSWADLEMADWEMAD